MNKLKSAIGAIQKNNLATNKNVWLMIEVDKVEPDPQNARKTYKEESIKELALSIAAEGLIQPITVFEHAEEKGKYLVSQGSRRLKAVQWLKENMPENPHSQTIRCFVDEELSKKAKLIENIQREDLKALEIGSYLKDISEEYGLNNKELSEAIGKPESWVSRHLALNKLSDFVLELVESERITNVEAIVNLQKLYERNKTFAETVIETISSDLNITTALTRTWLKRQEDAKRACNDYEETEDQSSPVQQQPVIQENDAVADNLVDSVQDDLLQSEAAQKQEEPKTVTKKDEQPAKPVQASADLAASYKKDILDDYRFLVDVVANGGAERSAIAKQLLTNLAGKENASINWGEAAKYSDLLGMFSDVVERFKMCGYVSPLELDSAEVEVIISQQELV